LKAAKVDSASNRSHKLVEKTLQWRRGHSQAIREAVERAHDLTLILRILRTIDGSAERRRASPDRVGTDHLELRERLYSA
jgi:hypothetical protein